MQGTSRFLTDSGKNRSEKPNDFSLFRENSLRGRAGNFFGRAGSLLRKKLAPSRRPRDLSEFAPSVGSERS